MNRKWSTVRGGGHSARSHAQLKQHQIEDRATVTDPLTSKLTNNTIAIGRSPTYRQNLPRTIYRMSNMN